jgi:hypothetical protein
VSTDTNTTARSDSSRVQKTMVEEDVFYTRELDFAVSRLKTTPSLSFETSKMISTRKLSRTAEQSTAEKYIRQQMAESLGVQLLRDKSIDLSAHHHVSVDAYCREPKILVEIYARIGALGSAQQGKIAKDVLKFSVIRKNSFFWKDARMLIALSSQAYRSVRSSWLSDAAKAHDIEFQIIELPREIERTVIQAQERQNTSRYLKDEFQKMANKLAATGL